MLSDEVDHRNAHGCTALHYAAARGKSHVPIIELLIDCGADVHHPNDKGKTPRDIAREQAEFKDNKHVRYLFELEGHKHIKHMANAAFLQAMAKGRTSSRESSRREDRESTTPRGWLGRQAVSSKAGTVPLVKPEMEHTFHPNAQSQAAAAQEAGGTERFSYRDDSAAMDEENMDDFRALFRLLTSHSDVYQLTSGLHVSHLIPVVEALGLEASRDTLKEVVALLDIDGDGAVDEDDFVRAMMLNDANEVIVARDGVDVPWRVLARGKDRLTMQDMEYWNDKLGRTFCAATQFERATVMKHFGRHDFGGRAIRDSRERRETQDGKQQEEQKQEQEHEEEEEEYSAAVQQQAHRRRPSSMARDASTYIDRDTFAKIADGTVNLVAHRRLVLAAEDD
eukprot:TRINITY_DN58588_c0_g1_i1.p2 TRINITY_DN58588_c0_g1~~TRINITY_DN58588_c0_g1_i1.p2  ORF type:complete len:395 (+),score=185.22 TRINITY_DN58588_c0_g1_i1:306-1490(+)